MNTPHYVYILRIITNSIANNTLYKIGYSGDVAHRIRSLHSSEKPSSEVRGKGVVIDSIYAMAIATFIDKDSAVEYEKSCHVKHKQCRYGGSPILPNGNKELFTENVAKLELLDMTSLFKPSYL